MSSCTSSIYNDFSNSFFAGSTHTIDLTVFDPATGYPLNLSGSYASFYATQNFSGSYVMMKDSGAVGGITFPSSSLVEITFNPADTSNYKFSTRLFFNIFVSSSANQFFNVGNGSIYVLQGANINSPTGSYPDYDQGWY